MSDGNSVRLKEKFGEHLKVGAKISLENLRQNIGSHMLRNF
jgi:hypothetical protein